VASVNLGVQQLGEEEGRLFFQELLMRASDLPGVESAALADFVFLVSPPQRSAVFSGPAGGSRVEAGLLGVSPEFFETADVEILEGRAFDATDVAGGEPVAIVNETVARMLWGDDDPIGKLLTSGDQSLRVVGVAETSKYIAVGESPLAAVFRPHTQHYVPKTSLVLRVRDGYPSVAREVERLVRSIDPEVPLSRNAPYDQLVGIHLLPRRLAGGFAGVLGGVALLLASVGLYGVLTQMVTQRKGELAIRMALGAEPRRLRRPVLWRGMAMVLAGLGLGIPVALAASNLMRVFLFGLDPADPLTFGSVTLVFILVGLGASYRPAMQATRTDPARILRQG
jgi:putative ABC transport system permease protein